MRFHDLHHGDRPLLPPNARDFASGAALADAGFPAVARPASGRGVAGVNLEDGRAETLRRARAYAEAGADGVFVPGIADVRALLRP
ncbi:hypothetical protein [Actinomadura chibensis]|uniref:Uncharacterized protein n=1 Tax=Actinomadura chibensis TaxID=392828 RepID=A0A5D0NB48_9ACTN|nr:hypothetical protein [Actinomadura chibensis]TYB41557.1 hypothetical protein FXF69_36275 [Actinomadura chibensis]